tara:strand:+ start:561 stop:1196 length:636 start_codon:yes stop_codon:yes gene_type:complete
MKYSCGAGLCNRLRVALSYLEYARSLGEELVFTWPINDACNEAFDLHFEPIDGLKITQELDRDHGWQDRHGVFPHPDHHPNYDLIKPKYEIDLIRTPYNAVHIRSSEHWEENRKNPSEFIRFIKESKLPVWLATDLRQTQVLVSSHGSVHTFATIEESDRIEELYRHTNLKHSVVDLFMCVKAQNFLGTKYSSFSETINCMRNQQGPLVNG